MLTPKMDSPITGKQVLFVHDYGKQSFLLLFNFATFNFFLADFGEKLCVCLSSLNNTVHNISARQKKYAESLLS